MARPKGYAAWSPKPDTLTLIRSVKAILAEYHDYLPLTVRQVFYRLVGAYGYDKTEKAYARLCEHLVRARRAQMIPFDAIRDDGTIHHEFASYTGKVDFWAKMTKYAKNYQRDHMAEQPVAIELWCEAGGMVPQLEAVASPYAIPVYSTGGFSSVTVTNEIAERALKRDKPTVFLHCGDFDPSGESIFEAMTVDAREFLLQRLLWLLKKTPEGTKVWEDHWSPDMLYPADRLPDDLPELRAIRVALTEDQVEEFDLPTAPPKSSDTRSVNWGSETCQLEALPPDQLAEVVTAAIESHIDHELYEETVEAERVERASLRRRLSDLIAEEGDGE